MSETGFSYSNPAGPEGYVCVTCGATGVKLWREYQSFRAKETLACAKCVDPTGEKGPIAEDGTVEWRGQRSDSIGWSVPAVPVDDTFWGYTSVPPEDVAWWKALPLSREETK
jgi:hypothetical protein